MLDNEVLETIRNRRNILRFEETSVENEKIQAILEAGRWAPSYINSQPWNLIVVTDQTIKESIAEIAPTVYKAGIRAAPVCIVVSVDPEKDPYHFIEDGAAATQNMALAAYSLGLGSSWIGILSLKNDKESSEEKIKRILNVPKNYRVISLMPTGVPKYWYKDTGRKELSQIVSYNKFKSQNI